MLKAAPAAGTRVIELEGTVALNFSNASNAAKTTLKAIPTATEWGSPGVETPIGPLRIEPSSSMSTDDAHYQGYQVVSPNAPVIAVGVVGGDASDEARGMGMGLEPGMFVIKGPVALHGAHRPLQHAGLARQLDVGLVHHGRGSSSSSPKSRPTQAGAVRWVLLRRHPTQGLTAVSAWLTIARSGDTPVRALPTDLAPSPGAEWGHG